MVDWVRGILDQDAALYDDVLAPANCSPLQMDGDQLYRTLARLALIDERRAA